MNLVPLQREVAGEPSRESLPPLASGQLLISGDQTADISVHLFTKGIRSRDQLLRVEWSASRHGMFLGTDFRHAVEFSRIWRPAGAGPLGRSRGNSPNLAVAVNPCPTSSSW